MQDNSEPAVKQELDLMQVAPLPTTANLEDLMDSIDALFTTDVHRGGGLRESSVFTLTGPSALLLSPLDELRVLQHPRPEVSCFTALNP